MSDAPAISVAICTFERAVEFAPDLDAAALARRRTVEAESSWPGVREIFLRILSSLRDTAARRGARSWD